MKKAGFLALLFAAFFSGTSDAAVTVFVDMDTSEAGVQSLRTVTAGEVFDVEFVISITDPTLLGAYTFSVRIDDTELGVNSVLPLNTPLGTAGNPTITSGGSLRQAELGDVPFLRIEGIAGFTFNAVGAGDYRVARAQLVVDTPTTDGFLDLLPGIFEPVDNFGDENFNNIDSQVSFVGGSVAASAIPEPGTWAVLGLASAGVVARRFRRKAAVAV